ncbi:unnamed protein product [Boreogadus saida]
MSNGGRGVTSPLYSGLSQPWSRRSTERPVLVVVEEAGNSTELRAFWWGAPPQATPISPSRRPEPERRRQRRRCLADRCRPDVELTLLALVRSSVKIVMSQFASRQTRRVSSDVGLSPSAAQLRRTHLKFEHEPLWLFIGLARRSFLEAIISGTHSRQVALQLGPARPAAAVESARSSTSSSTADILQPGDPTTLPKDHRSGHPTLQRSRSPQQTTLGLFSTLLLWQPGPGQLRTLRAPEEHVEKQGLNSPLLHSFGALQRGADAARRDGPRG